MSFLIWIYPFLLNWSYQHLQRGQGDFGFLQVTTVFGGNDDHHFVRCVAGVFEAEEHQWYALFVRESGRN